MESNLWELLSCVKESSRLTFADMLRVRRIKAVVYGAFVAASLSVGLRRLGWPRCPLSPGLGGLDSAGDHTPAFKFAMRVSVLLSLRVCL